MRIYLYYFLSMIIMMVYGGRVCPFIDNLTLLRWGKILAVFFIIIFIVRTLIVRSVIHKKPLIQQTGLQFKIEFLVFLLSGIALAMYNQFAYAFPPLASGGKVIIGMLTLGTFLAIDMALERERSVILEAQKQQVRLIHKKKFFSLTRKFSIVAVLVLIFIASVILLVIGKDIYWISSLDSDGIGLAQKRITIEVLFVVGITTALVLNLIYSYTRNLKLFFENEMQVLDEVNKGILDGHIPTIGNDEFAQIADYTNTMIEGLREKRKIKNVFGKVVSKEIASRLLSAGEDALKLGGQKRQVVLLVSDIRNFTNYTESMDPEKLVSGLNTYFTTMIQVIHKNNGMVDKFIGDGILAVFGLDDPTHAAMDAVKASLEMQEEVVQSQSSFSIPISIGVGIHGGNVIAGNIGSPERLEFTFIGDPVNTAARLEGMTKPLEATILISETIYNQLDETLTSRPWKDFGDQSLKGKSKPVKVWGLVKENP